MTSDETTTAFGQRKRDWTTLYRIAVLVCTIFCAGGVGVYLYAGTRYVREAAQNEVADAVKPLQDIPPRVRRLEELTIERGEVLRDLSAWRRSKDEIDTRLTILIENQQRQIERQQTIIDRLTERVK